MRVKLCVAMAAACAVSAPTAKAVALNPHGIGQVLIYPYYTVNAGFGTLLSVVNTTNEGKALKVHVREGYNGRSVLTFNLYLSPFDAWVAQIFDTSADGSGAAGMASNDNSCTVPAFLKTFSPTPGGGPGVAPFSTARFSGSNADGGPATPDRTREGYVEIIEMGTVTNATHQTLNAITHTSAGVPASCAQLITAWSGGGYWAADPGVDMSAPDGGLYGAEALINVANGLMYAVNAEAIDGFSSAVQHADPGNATPDLGSASKDVNGIVSAFVPVGAGMVEADYTVPADAISALFMADNLYNEYVIDPGLNAASDWLVTFPTKRFYVDPALLPAGSPARQPFDVPFTGDNGGSACAAVEPLLANREESVRVASCGLPECPPIANVLLCYSTNALVLGQASGLGSHVVVEGSIDGTSVGFVAGQLRLNLTHNNDGSVASNHVLTSANGVTFAGMPAVGFLAVDYVNGNVTPGTLANYSGTSMHRASVSCTRGADPAATCP